MSHTETQDVTYYSGHEIDVNGKRYVSKRTCNNVAKAEEFFRCSACDTAFSTDDLDTRLFRNGFLCSDFDFCPFCGAEVVE